ncbi:protein-tyrosine phosphatase-like protein [Jimgerdemannia flammicorona]|uniref:protein-tyrosine-phosphatase n=1 Tax=Jimgerdemannia flammicorona TaxID=994334 RepID=A0A433D3S4_9FUNG|nr:protein-tyrosine phosphatase-like protein [Jimgerdemannia flammicorona]
MHRNPRKESPMSRQRQLLLDPYARGASAKALPPHRISPFLFISDSGAAAALPHLIDLGITHIVNLSGCSDFWDTPEKIDKEWARLAKDWEEDPRICPTPPTSDLTQPPYTDRHADAVFARLYQAHSTARPIFNPPAYHSISIPDSPGVSISTHFPDCINFINNARESLGDPEDTSTGARILIHCVQGISRSASIAIAYVMSDQQIGYEPAFRIVKEARPAVWPNVGFRSQLKEFEKTLKLQGDEGGTTRRLWKKFVKPAGSS